MLEHWTSPCRCVSCLNDWQNKSMGVVLVILPHYASPGSGLCTPLPCSCPCVAVPYIGTLQCVARHAHIEAAVLDGCSCHPECREDLCQRACADVCSLCNLVHRQGLPVRNSICLVHSALKSIGPCRGCRCLRST